MAILHLIAQGFSDLEKLLWGGLPPGFLERALYPDRKALPAPKARA